MRNYPTVMYLGMIRPAAVEIEKSLMTLQMLVLQGSTDGWVDTFRDKKRIPSLRAEYLEDEFTSDNHYDRSKTGSEFIKLPR